MRVDQFVFRHAVYGPTVWLRGEPLSRCLADLEKSQWASPEALVRIQEDKLNLLVDLAVRTVPYYRERIDRSSLPRRLTLADMHRLPVLSKEDLREHRERLRAPGFRRVTVKTTGGSTGQAMTVLKSRMATAYELAAMWRGWGWAGVTIGDRQARFWGVPATAQARWRSRLIDFVSHRKRFTAFGMDDASMEGITTTLNRFQPDFAYGYVSVLHHYADYLDKRASRRFQPKAVIATSEILTSAHRLALQRGFGCPVFEEYGCGELGNIAHECEKGGLHLSAENMIVEILEGEAPAGHGRAGELLVTELNNHAMPLLRYRLKDFGVVADAPCACGRALPTLASVAGRAYDLVYNREGKLFHGEFFMYILEDAKKKGLGIDGFQVVQMDAEQFLIRVRPGAGYGTDAEAFVTRRIRDGYGAYAQVSFETVADIPREPSGKLRLIIGAPDPQHRN